MAKDYVRKYRGFPSLTPKRKAELLETLSVGAPIELASEAAGIVKDTYYRWIRGQGIAPQRGFARYPLLRAPPALSNRRIVAPAELSAGLALR